MLWPPGHKAHSGWVREGRQRQRAGGQKDTLMCLQGGDGPAQLEGGVDLGEDTVARGPG